MLTTSAREFQEFQSMASPYRHRVLSRLILVNQEMGQVTMSFGKEHVITLIESFHLVMTKSQAI